MSLVHFYHASFYFFHANLSFDQNQSRWDQFSSSNCSWLMYQFKYKNTNTINQIKSNPAVNIFHGHSVFVAEASAYLAGTGDTYFQPTLCSVNTSHLPLQAFKTCSLPLAWTRLRPISLQSSQWKAPHWDPQWHTGHTHTHSRPL